MKRVGLVCLLFVVLIVTGIYVSAESTPSTGPGGLYRDSNGEIKPNREDDVLKIKNLHVWGAYSGVLPTYAGITTIFADYSANYNRHQIVCDATNGTVTIYAPPASTIKNIEGNMMKIDSSGNSCILTPAGVETINGAANYVISTQYDNITYWGYDSNSLLWR